MGEKGKGGDKKKDVQSVRFTYTKEFDEYMMGNTNIFHNIYVLHIEFPESLESQD